MYSPAAELTPFDGFHELVHVDAFAAFHNARPLLERILAPHGFQFVDEGVGAGSGGRFQRGAWVRGDGRRLEYSVRESLGDVAYLIPGLTLSHEAYIRGVSEQVGVNAYPGFSTDVLEAFRHLILDLDRFGEPFLSGSDADMRHVAAAQRHWHRHMGSRHYRNPP
jgi:hypothetical protein